MVKINKLVLDYVDSQLNAYNAEAVELIECVAEESKLVCGADSECSIEEWAEASKFAIIKQIDEMRSFLTEIRDKQIDLQQGKNVEIDLIEKAVHLGYSHELTGRILPFYNVFTYDGYIKKELHFDSEDLYFDIENEPTRN